jgi:hypothetical protein
MDNLIKCGYCNKQIEEPQTLPCGHIFCKSCISSNDKGGKIVCASCKTEHSGGKSSAKESKLAQFLTRFITKEYDEIEIDPIEKEETEGRCEECPPPPQPKPAKPGEPQPPAVVLPKVRACFHCKKKLCENCRNKHYHNARLTVIKMLEDYKNGSSNLLQTSEKLNDNRQKNILEYQKYQNDIKKRKQDLAKQLDKEETDLLNQVDKAIAESKG